MFALNAARKRCSYTLCCGVFWLMSVAILSQVAPLANCSFRSLHPRWMSPVTSAQDAPRKRSSSVWCRAFQHHRAAEHPSIRGRHAKLINMSQRPTALTTQKAESDSVCRRTETKNTHKSKIFWKVTWADILKRYVSRPGFGTQPPRGPQGQENCVSV